MASEPRQRAAQADWQSWLLHQNTFGIVRSLPDGGDILDCNNVFARLFGFDSAREIVGQRLETLNRDRAARREMMELLRRTGAVDEFELHIECERRGSVWMLCTLRMIQQQPWGEIVEGACLDITQRKENEQRLRSSETHYRALFEHNVAAITRSALEGEILECNQAAAELMGYASAAEVQGLNRWEYFGDERRSAEVRDALLREGAYGGLELPLRRRDGSQRWVLSSGTLIEDAGGHLSIFTTSMDISAMRAAKEQLAASEARLKVLLEQLPAALWITDRELVVVSMAGNAAPKELLGTSITARAADVVNAHRQALAGHSSTYVTVYDGRTFQSHVEPLRESDGSITGVIGVAHDITAGEQTRSELARSNAELENFAYIASHDLQEPLRTINNFTELLLQRFGDHLDEDGREFAGYITGAVERMQHLITGLLAFSRLGRQPTDDQPVEANAVLEAALANLDSAINESGAVIHAGRLPTLRIDPNQLLQLFQNLLSNAIKFYGERPPEVWVDCRKQNDGQLRFSVRDNGIGIPPQYYERIFQIFQRLHTQREYAGSGLGLSMCRKIVERYGGRIGLESTPGEGTTFYFTLPAAQQEGKGEGRDGSVCTPGASQ